MIHVHVFFQIRGFLSEVMRRATLPKVERVNRLAGNQRGDFVDVMMAEVYSPWHFYVQVLGAQSLRVRHDSVIIWTHLDGSQLKDPGSNRPDYELDDLVDDMEDAYSKLSDLDQCIPLEELKVTSICNCDKTEVGLGYKSLQTGGFTMCSQKPRREEQQMVQGCHICSRWPCSAGFKFCSINSGNHLSGLSPRLWSGGDSPKQSRVFEEYPSPVLLLHACTGPI